MPRPDSSLRLATGWQDWQDWDGKAGSVWWLGDTFPWRDAALPKAAVSTRVEDDPVLRDTYLGTVHCVLWYLDIRNVQAEPPLHKSCR